MRNRRAAILTALVLGVAPVAPAAAGNVTVRIPYGDLDMSQPGTAEVLQQRIKAAAERACTFDSAYTGPQLDVACVTQASNAALAIAKKRFPAEVLAAAN